MIRNLKNSSKRKLCNVLFLLPACIVFAVFVLVPFLQGIPLSLYQWDGYSDTRTFVSEYNGGCGEYIVLYIALSDWL